jgi:hypothetical protein
MTREASFWRDNASTSVSFIDGIQLLSYCLPVRYR